MAITDDSESYDPNDNSNGAGAIDTSDAQPAAQATVQSAQPSAGLPDMGPPPVAQHLAQTSAAQGASDVGSQMASDIGQGVQNFKNDPIVKRLISYVTGADGDPAAAINNAQRVKQQAPHLSDGDAALVSLDQTAQTKGPDAAWKELQGHRAAYNAKQAFAKVALEGVQGKPANLASAVDAANKAMMHIPDGSNVRFTPSQNGVTAAVTMPGTTHVQQIPLSVDQFKQFVDVGGAGQWDKVQQRTVPATLQALSRNQPVNNGMTKLSQMRPLQQQAPTEGISTQSDDGDGDDDQSTQQAAPSEAVRRGQPIARDVTEGDQPAIPGTHDANGHSLSAPGPDTTNYGDELEARSRKVFPGAGQEPERQNWMAAQEDKELARQNAVDVAGEKGKWADKRAATAGGFRVQAADVAGQHKENGWKFSSQEKARTAQARIDGIVAQERAKNGRAAQNSEASILRAKMAAGQTLDDSDQALLKKFGVAADTAISAPQPQSQAPQQQSQAPSKQLSAHDQQAAAWARANPNDPRAAQIMQKIGAQ